MQFPCEPCSWSPSSSLQREPSGGAWRVINVISFTKSLLKTGFRAAFLERAELRVEWQRSSRRFHRGVGNIDPADFNFTRNE